MERRLRLFHSGEEEYDVLNQFFKEAVDNGEKNLHIVHPTLMVDHRRRLAASEIDVQHCEACRFMAARTVKTHSHAGQAASVSAALVSSRATLPYFRTSSLPGARAAMSIATSTMTRRCRRRIGRDMA